MICHARSGAAEGRRPHTSDMTTWIVIAAVVAIVVVVAVLRMLLRDEEDRRARRELRRLRRRERNPDLRGAAEHRHNMMMDQVPGRDTHPHGS